MLDVEGTIRGDTVFLNWKTIEGSTNYSVSVEKCDIEDRNNLCNKIFQIFTPENSLTASNEAFNTCTYYNAKVIAFSFFDKQPLFKETTLIRKSPSDCDKSHFQLILIIVLVIIFFLILVCVALIVFFHKKKPIHKLQRVRSKVYCRLYSKEQYGRPIPKSEFVSRIGELLSNPVPDSMNVLKMEYEELEQISFDTIQRKTSASNVALNRKRIRYTDIVPYDANRVILNPPIQLKGDKVKSDFINASHVVRPLHRYIAAQGPSEDTSPLFWEMIWQQNARVIVMLTKLVEGVGFGSLKCSQYWPDTVGSASRFHDIDVQLFDIQEAPDYIVRKFDVSRRGESESREIIHIQYISWPDRSALQDPNSLLQLIQVTRALDNQYNKNSSKKLWVVHCSAGIGRTGTFIAVDQLLRLADERHERTIDVFNHVYNLRKERRFMVQTDLQYIFIYQCLLHYLLKKRKKSTC